MRAVLRENEAGTKVPKRAAYLGTAIRTCHQERRQEIQGNPVDAHGEMPFDTAVSAEGERSEDGVEDT